MQITKEMNRRFRRRWFNEGHRNGLARGDIWGCRKGRHKVVGEGGCRKGVCKGGHKKDGFMVGGGTERE